MKPPQVNIVATVNGKRFASVINLLAYDLNQPRDQTMLLEWLKMVQREAQRNALEVVK